MKWLHNLVDTFIAPIRDFRVLGWTAIVGTLAFFVDPQGLKMIGVVLHVFFFWLFALSVRKAFFPYRSTDADGKSSQIKLSHFFKEALNGNVAAAIVAFAQIIMMCCIAISFVLWVR
jgi:signal transduction histidine kinase